MIIKDHAIKSSCLNDQIVLVTYNIGAAPGIGAIQKGDIVEFYSEYK